MKVRIAVSAAAGTVERDGFLDFIDGLEERGFDTVWLSDVPLGSIVDPMLGLAVAAGRTTNLKLGANIVAPGRNPMLLAKELAHLDRLSDGRLLVSFVPGIGNAQEKAALGLDGIDRGRVIEETIELCRRWWQGEAVTTTFGDHRYEDVALDPPPIQEPLEIWLGGTGPKALDRAGRLSDGWLTSRSTPEQAAKGRATIQNAAADAGREVDGEHFGISIPYARSEPDAELVAGLLKRTDADRPDVLPVGAGELRSLLERHVEHGLSKFVVRPITRHDGWEAELDWLADTALPLQS